MSITLGKRYRDTVTGIEGVAIGRAEHLHGCYTVGIQYLKDNEPKTIWFDEPQLEPVESDQLARTSGTGGPKPEPQRKDDPS